MKLHTRMPKKLLPFFRQELSLYKTAFLANNLPLAWNHLERAHVIGQSYPYQHSLAHWKMLMFGIRIKSIKEVIGQIPRLIVGGVKSFVGHVPVGNTGGSNIPPLRRMPISDDIKAIFKEADISNP